MKKILIIALSLYSFAGNAALKREEERRITEGAVVTTLLPDIKTIEADGFPDVARHMGSVVGELHVRSFMNRTSCDLMTRFLNARDGEPVLSD